MPIQINWLRFPELLYVLAFFFLFVIVAATAYAPSHPELGLEETNPLVCAYMAAYGLVAALLIALLVNASVLVLSGLFFTLYRMFQSRYNWHNPFIDSIAYALVVTFGLCVLITWLLNAAKDIHVLLFHSYHDVISNVWSFWQDMTLYVVLAIFVALFLFLYRSPRVRECMHSSFLRRSRRISMRDRTIFLKS